jgi:CxxC motif-containing protein (DUF1111 family)
VRADPSDRDGDGISGTYNLINGPGSPRHGLVGRFGWKAQFVRLHDFSLEAYLDEMGITTPFRPLENGPQGGPVACDGEPDPEDDGRAVAAFTDLLMLLAPPPRESIPSDAWKGRRLFRALGCQDCHMSRYHTTEFPVGVLERRRRVLLHSDLLLHDMGPELADGIQQGSATGTEWRTAPLWGVRYSAPYLHDGRAATLVQAIEMHGGGAQAARDTFLQLSPEQRAALIRYLSSL